MTLREFIERIREPDYNQDTEVTVDVVVGGQLLKAKVIDIDADGNDPFIVAVV